MKKVFVHGLGQTPSSWNKVIESLEAAACCECPDLVGMVRENGAAYDNLYASFAGYCDRYNETLDLCGLSLGGVLALNYTVDHPEKVNSLVLIAAPYKMPKFLLTLQNVLFSVMPESAFEQMGFHKRAVVSLCKTMAKLDFSALLGKIACPTMVACGDNDRANKKAAKELAAAIRDSRLVIVSKAGHEVNIDAPEKLAEVLRDFYETCRVQA